MTRRSENFSVYVTNTLNAIGFKWETIQQRRSFVKEFERTTDCVHLANSGLTFILTGSKREAASKPLGGDYDAMIVLDEMVATETPELFEYRNSLTVLQIDTTGCPPGYSSLTPVKHGGRFYCNILTHGQSAVEMDSRFLQSVLDDNCCRSDHGQVYVSSEIFIGNMFNMLQSGLERCQVELFPDSSLLQYLSLESISGPALQFCTDTHMARTSYDMVFSIPCHCPSTYERFRTRRRKHGWPQESVIEELSQLEAHVVPVGYKRSQLSFQEWRICFTKAEIRLLECLTESQTHVFILLKLFAKFVLKKVWDVMTFYVMKNIILWIAELTPTQRFRSDTIVDRFLDCLFFLKICIKGGKLPNYMIHERNLLSHGTYIVKKLKVVSFLDECLQEKGSCLLRIPLLKESMLKMYSEPELMILNGLDRDQTEHLMVSFVLRLLPEIGLAKSLQDPEQYDVISDVSAFYELCMQRFSRGDKASDPVALMQKVSEMISAHLH